MAMLLRYSRTSKFTYEAVSSYMRRNFRLDKLIGRFFTENEILKFRYLQSQSGMLISGSTALQFFDRAIYPESDLDIYVEHRYCMAIALWLVSIGYTYKPRPKAFEQDLEDALLMTPLVVPETTTFRSSWTGQGGYSYSGVAQVYKFHRNHPDRKMQLITSHHSPLELVLNFHSTCVMNLISHEKAYALFPRGTFEERRSLVCYKGDSNEEAAKSARDKYVARGWKLVEPPLPEEEVLGCTSAFTVGSRYVGDSKCWSIPILPKLPLSESYIEMNSWNLRYDEENTKAYMSFKNLMAPTLRYSYLVKDWTLQQCISNFPLKRKTKYSDDILKRLLKLYWDVQ